MQLSVLDHLSVPPRIAVLLEGESLINDASGLVLFRFAVAAALTGAFSAGAAAGSFVYVSAVGIGIGLALGWICAFVAGRLTDARLTVVWTFLSAWAAYLLADWWSKYLWGYILGPLFGGKERTVKNLKRLPKEARSHKELILRYYGWEHALKPASEAGVDLSNAPGTYVSLLPAKPEEVVEDIRAKIYARTGKNVTVIVIDTDATYRLAGINFTSLPYPISQIKSNLGNFAYLLGRVGTNQGPTPLAVSKALGIEKILEISSMAEECQKENEITMKTIYDMAQTFEEDFSGITGDMLDSVPHTPAVIVRML